MKSSTLLIFTLALFFADGTSAKKSYHLNPTQISNFGEAKKYLNKHLDLFDNKTVYCGCSVIATSVRRAGGLEPRKRVLHTDSSQKDPSSEELASPSKLSVDIASCGYKVQSNPKRARRLEWEHVVPAEAFGQSFAEWRVGVPKCARHGKMKKGRKCAETNIEFQKMESDLYNLFPEIGELNGLRSNYSMAQISGPTGRFGGCAVKLLDRKFEPQDSAKGVVARTYMNFENKYPGRRVVSGKNKKLFEAWDKEHPVSDLECRRWRAFEPINGYSHLFASRCK
jgi:deoxyribonuclease-1